MSVLLSGCGSPQWEIDRATPPRAWATHPLTKRFGRIHAYYKLQPAGTVTAHVRPAFLPLPFYIETGRGSGDIGDYGNWVTDITFHRVTERYWGHYAYAPTWRAILTGRSTRLQSESREYSRGERYYVPTKLTSATMNMVLRDQIIAPTAGKQDEFYTYDGLSQLRKLQRGNLNYVNDVPTGIQTGTSWEEEWAFDPTGDWHQSGTPVPAGGGYIQRMLSHLHPRLLEASRHSECGPRNRNRIGSLGLWVVMISATCGHHSPQTFHLGS